ncbi:MAG: hypothetical protein WA974_01760 [Thermodesulfobacteriota bacterium]
MKSSKPFIMISVVVLVVWTAWSVQGSELVSQTWFPEKSPFSHAFSQPSPVLGRDYNAALPGVNALLQPFFKMTMEETAQQGLPPVYPPASVWAYNIKDGGGGLFSLQRSFYGYFWDTSGRIKNTNGTHGFADLAHTFGPATPHIYLGHENAKNNNEWKVGDDDITRMMYGVSIDYKVTDVFYVIPVFTYYDWSNQLEVATKPDTNKEWIGGLQVRFIF